MVLLARIIHEGRVRPDAGTGRSAKLLASGEWSPAKEEEAYGTMADQNDQRADQLARSYQVRQVTNIQASWTEQGRGQPGRFTLQLILDNGVEEYVLEPSEGDIDVILKIFARSGHTTFDLERKVLMFSNLTVK